MIDKATHVRDVPQERFLAITYFVPFKVLCLQRNDYLIENLMTELQGKKLKTSFE